MEAAFVAPVHCGPTGITTVVIHNEMKFIYLATCPDFITAELTRNQNRVKVTL